MAFVCARSICRGVVVPDLGAGQPALRCSSCGAIYPLLGGELPVLVPDSARHLAGEAIRLRRDLGWFQQQRSLLAAGERRFPRRVSSQRQVRAALEETSNSFVEVLGMLVAQLDPAVVVDVAAQPPADSGAYGARLTCALLRRDFGGEPEAEEEIGQLVAAVTEELTLGDKRRGRVLVLGCGAGRLAEELAATGWAVTAIDLSAVLSSAALLLRSRRFDFHHVQTRNSRMARDQATALGSGRPAITVPTRRIRYAVADATAMPFEDEAWPAIVSVYFTDVVPLSRLLPEVFRVLAPGGRFIHVGPLGYHFDDPAEHLAADELIDGLRFAGFDVGTPRWIRSTHHRTSGSLCFGSIDNLVFSAKKARRRLRADPPSPPFRGT